MTRTTSIHRELGPMYKTDRDRTDHGGSEGQDVPRLPREPRTPDPTYKKHKCECDRGD